MSRVITVCKADPIRDGVTGVCLDITEPIPNFDALSVGQHREFFADQAETVHDALSILPGGTLDALFALMAADRTSLLRVQRPGPAAVDEQPAAADDDVVDAYIVDWEEQCADLEKRRDAALAALDDESLDILRRLAVARIYLGAVPSDD